jgi:hypothetical protein
LQCIPGVAELADAADSNYLPPFAGLWVRLPPSDTARSKLPQNNEIWDFPMNTHILISRSMPSFSN